MSEKKTPAQMAEEGYQAIIKGREKHKNMTPEEILMEEIEDDAQGGYRPETDDNKD